MPFDFVIDPCEVVWLGAPADLDATYTIQQETTLMAIEYNFAQSPCSYGGTYRATLETSGGQSTLPTFIKAFREKPLLTVYTVDVTDAGEYQINLCHDLDKRQYATAAPLQKDLISTSCFSVRLEVKLGEGLEKINNSAPVLF